MKASKTTVESMACELLGDRSQDMLSWLQNQNISPSHFIRSRDEWHELLSKWLKSQPLGAPKA